MVGEFEVFHRETDIAFPRAIGVEDAKALFRDLPSMLESEAQV